MKVSIICPLYNAEKYVERLVKKIRSQVGIEYIELIFPVTNSKDRTYELAKIYGDISYLVKVFNHSLTRHEAVKYATGEYIVFITQDMLPYDNKWLINLLSSLDEKKKIIAAFSRQIANKEHGIIETEIRKLTYPKKDYIIEWTSLNEIGRRALFFSNVSSAFYKEIFLKIGGFNFIVNTNEDVIIAYNILKSGYKYKYISKSKVFHSHNYNIIELYKRYYNIGKFEIENRVILDKVSKSENEGKKIFFKILNKLWKERYILKIIKLIINFIVRYIGYKIGKGINTNERN